MSEIQVLVASCRMVDAAREFADALRGAGLQPVEYVAFDGEDHSTVVPAALMRGLGHALPQTAD